MCHRQFYSYQLLSSLSFCIEYALECDDNLDVWLLWVVRYLYIDQQALKKKKRSSHVNSVMLSTGTRTDVDVYMYLSMHLQ